MTKTAFFLLTSLVCFSGCQRASDSVRLRTVVVTQPESSCIAGPGYISLPGTVREGQMVKVSFKTAGQISRLNVKEGDYVCKGQVIATLDESDYRIAVNAAQAQYTQVKNEVERVKTLYERNSVSKNEYEKAMAGLEQVTANLQSQKNQLQYTVLHSPASGYVQRIGAHVGEMVNAGTTIVSLIDVGLMEVEIGLPYSLYQQRDRMYDFSALLDGKEYPISKLNVIPKADGTQQYTMLFALPSDRVLRDAAGQNVEVRFKLRDSHKTSEGMTIPESSIFYDDAKPCVWVLKVDSTVTRKHVVTGQVHAGRVEVTQGLDGIETIVRAGVSMLHEGEKVIVRQQNSSTNPGSLL